MADYLGETLDETKNNIVSKMLQKSTINDQEELRAKFDELTASFLGRNRKSYPMLPFLESKNIATVLSLTVIPLDLRLCLLGRILGLSIEDIAKILDISNSSLAGRLKEFLSRLNLCGDYSGEFDIRPLTSVYHEVPENSDVRLHIENLMNLLPNLGPHKATLQYLFENGGTLQQIAYSIIKNDFLAELSNTMLIDKPKAAQVLSIIEFLQTRLNIVEIKISGEKRTISALLTELKALLSDEEI
jgi:hypothetical protein